MTPRELYASMEKDGELPPQMDSVHASYAKAILRRQAGSLCKERCVESVTFTPDGSEPWVIGVLFGDGELSNEAQLTLAKMRENAHKASIIGGDAAVQISFYVYGNNREDEENDD